MYLKHTIWDTGKGTISATRLQDDFLTLWVVYCAPRYYYEIDTTTFNLTPGQYESFEVPFQIVVDEPEPPNVLIFTASETSVVCGDAVITLGDFDNA